MRAKLWKNEQYNFMTKNKQNIFKVLHKRHPFERLYSGWRDKFFNQKEKRIFMKMYGQDIMKFSAKNDDHNGPGRPAVPFISFLKYINNTNMNKINNHFKPISFFCSPCELNFNYISSMTTLNTDMLTVFDIVANSTGNVDEIKFLEKVEKLRDKNLLKNLKPYAKVGGGNDVKGIFCEIDRVEPGLLKGIYDRYKWDFDLFGYSMDGYVLK